MKLDSVMIRDHGDPPHIVVRLYNFDAAEAQHLLGVVYGLAVGVYREVSVSSFCTSIDGTDLTFVRSDRNRGVVRMGERQFRCELTADYWDDMSYIIEPFTESVKPTAWNWLEDLDDPTDIWLLLSVDGGW